MIKNQVKTNLVIKLDYIEGIVYYPVFLLRTSRKDIAYPYKIYQDILGNHVFIYFPKINNEMEAWAVLRKDDGNYCGVKGWFCHLGGDSFDDCTLIELDKEYKIDYIPTTLNKDIMVTWIRDRGQAFPSISVSDDEYWMNTINNDSDMYRVLVPFRENYLKDKIMRLQEEMAECEVSFKENMNFVPDRETPEEDINSVLEEFSLDGRLALLTYLSLLSEYKTLKSLL